MSASGKVVRENVNQLKFVLLLTAGRVDLQRGRVRRGAVGPGLALLPPLQHLGLELVQLVGDDRAALAPHLLLNWAVREKRENGQA